MAIQPHERALFTADRWFRILGSATVMALASTAVLLFAEGSAWRVVFVVAHLAALLGLLPLAVVLVMRAYHQSGGLVPMVKRYPAIALFVACLTVTVAASLLNFNGNRDARRIANLAGIVVVLILVARYLRWSRQPRT